MIVDIFPFFNELDVLELRLRELDDFVDHFVAFQSTETFSGLSKPLHLAVDDDRWRPWKGRLFAVTVPRFTDAKDSWDREQRTRDAMAPWLADHGYADEDVVIVGDLDEIPNKAIVARLLPALTADRHVGLKTALYYYYLNLRSSKDFGPIAVARMATVKRIGARNLRWSAYKSPPVVPTSGGWHFSYQGGIDQIRAKFAASVHPEFNTDYFKDRWRLARCIADRREPFGPGKDKPLRVVGLEEMPGEVRAHPDRYVDALLGVGVA